MTGTGSCDSREFHLILLYEKEAFIDVVDRMHPYKIKPCTRTHTIICNKRLCIKIFIWKIILEGEGAI